MPSLDFLIKIYIRDQIIVGSTLPGIPAIINGNNNYINWAFTKGRSDVFTYFCDEKKNNDTHKRNQVNETIYLKERGVHIYHSSYRTNNGPIIFNNSDNFMNNHYNKTFSLNLRSFQTDLFLKFLISLIEIQSIEQLTTLSSIL